MSETSEPTTAPVTTSEPVTPVARTEPVVVKQSDRRPSRVVAAAAWVGIVAGTVFIIAVVFFSGFVLGKHSGDGGHRGGSPRHHEMMFREGPPMPMMPMRPAEAFGPGGLDGPGGPRMHGPGPGDFESAQPVQPNRPTTLTPPARP